MCRPGIRVVPKPRRAGKPSIPAASNSPKEGVALFPKHLKKGMTSVKLKISPETLVRQNFAHQCISINNYLWRSVTELVFNSLNICPLNAI